MLENFKMCMNDGKAIDALLLEKVLEISSKIPDEDYQMIGFNKKYADPSWMIIQNLAVTPGSSFHISLIIFKISR